MKHDTDTIQRCPHDKENPYAQINRDLIRDENISPECRWFLIYLLSMKNGWQLNIAQVHSHVKKFMGRNRVYKMVNEAIQAGYIKREENKSGNLKSGFKYYISESPKFKNIFRHPCFRDTEARDPENEYIKEKHSSLNREEKDKPIYKEAPKSEKKASAPPQVSADADSLCTFFFEKIRERNPEFKEPKLEKWRAEFDCLLRIDKRDPSKVRDLIEWASTHKWWKSACLSPSKLRKDFDVMMAQKGGDSEKELVRKNRHYAMQLKEKHPNEMRGLSFDDKFAINRLMAKEIPFNLPEETFKKALIEMFGGTYVRRN
jgi:hypothetical protein